jgi:hypothetical protein
MYFICFLSPCYLLTEARERDLVQPDYEYGPITKPQCNTLKSFDQQVILKKTLERRQVNDVVAKIALQINAKLGGELWACKSVYVSVGKIHLL